MNPALPPIQMLWVRGPFSRLELLSIRSFLANGHSVHLYVYDRPENVPTGVTVLPGDEILPRELTPAVATDAFTPGSYGSFSDLFRYTLLLRRGGWWADVDIVCTKPWQFAADALTASTDEFGYGRLANTCVMRFPPGHPVMQRCQQECSRLDLRRVGIESTGPNLLHAQMEALGAHELAVDPSVFCPVPWNASWQLVRPRWRRFTWGEFKQRIRRPHLNCRFTDQTVAVHLWNETWRAAGREKAAHYSRSCLYERLQLQWNRTGS